MLEKRTINEIKEQLKNSFGIIKVVTRPVLSTTEKDINIGTLSSALPSIFYRAEITFEDFENNIYLVFALVEKPEEMEATYAYNRNTIRILNYSQNPKNNSEQPKFLAELKENNLDENFETLYRQFNKNLESSKFEEIFSKKDLDDAKLSFYNLDNILNKTKDLRTNMSQEVKISDELQTFQVDPQLFNQFNLLDLQKACSLFLEARCTNFHNQDSKSKEHEFVVLNKIRWNKLFNTYTTKNVAITHLHSKTKEEFFNFFKPGNDDDSILLSLYFTIIKDMNALEEDLFDGIFYKLGVDFKDIEKNLKKRIKFFQDEQAARNKYKENDVRRKRTFNFEYERIANPNINKTRDALIYMEVVLKEIALKNNFGDYLKLPGRERNFNMFLRTKFAYFKRIGLIDNSKNGMRYILTSKGADFLIK
tara:strand:+ start:161 stop:1423 length:1263 start_codon:yes stop_codon:yes gene_type:complete